MTQPISNAPPTRPASGDEPEIDILALLSVLWKGKIWIAAITAMAMVLGAISVLRTEPLYQADGLLQVEGRSGAMGLPAGMQDLLGGTGLSTGKSPGEAEIALMKSRMVIGGAVRELNLEIYATPRPMPVLGLIPARLSLPDPGIGFLAPYRWGNEALEIAEMEMEPALIGREFVLTITGPDSYLLAFPTEGETGTAVTVAGRARERLSVAEHGVSLMVERLEGPAGREFTLGRMEFADAIMKIQQDFSVSESPEYSLMLRTRYTDPDPARATKILNAIARSYVSQNIDRSAAEAQNSLDFIDEQLPIAQRNVTAAQDALNAYRQAQQSVDVNYETQALLERATAIEAELSALALREEELKNRYTINHPTYQSLLQNRKGLETQLEQLRKETGNLPETQKEIFNLTRNLEVAQQVYLQLLNRAQELRVIRASTVGSVRIIDDAWSDGIRIAPRSSRTIVVHMLAGLVLGAGFVFLRRMLRQGVRGAQEIERLGLPVFATLTFSEKAANHRRRKGDLAILALSDPDDLVTEALRSLRTSLHFGMLDAKNNSLLLTSAAPGAGKSFTAVNFAVIAAQGGQKVCLIDADLRRGYLRRYFGKPRNNPGLSELLAGEKTLDEVMFHGPVAEGMLSVITAGRFPPNPSELLMRAEFTKLLDELNERFDLVIIDSPPTLAVTDPVVIGRLSGATILVARHLETMPGEIQAVQHSFESAGVRVTGAILNGYKVSEGSKYGGQNYYYNYRYTYKSDQS